MKNVLVISSSPRKDGNSDLLCHEFAAGAREAGAHVEEVALRSLEIKPCLACYSCFKTGVCVQRDDMGDLLRKIDKAEVLVVASPTYFLTMCGQLKVMIDRLLPKWQGLGGKDVYLIATGHDSRAGLERVVDDLQAIFENLGDRVCGVVWGERVWQKGEVLDTPALAEAHAMGAGLVSSKRC